MKGFNWDKIKKRSLLYKQKQELSLQKEQIRINKMLEYDIQLASDKQREYVQNILKCPAEDLADLSINKARRIIGEYENKTPATEKQKNQIKRKKLLIESKIDGLTIKEAKNIISAGELIQKKIDKKNRDLVNKQKFLRSRKKNNRNKGKK